MMSDNECILSCLIFLIISIYFFIVLNWRNAFYKYTHTVIPAKNESKIKVTVIVPFRDEIKNISKVFDALANQNYPGGMLQIIFSDDHSTDGSDNIIREKISLLKRKD